MTTCFSNSFKTEGSIFNSPGCSYTYQVLGPCCRLFDREQLPWPCCRLEWKGKEPFWNRQGKRFIPDIGCKGHPSYAAYPLGWPTSNPIPFVVTLFHVNLNASEKEWWVTPSSKLQHYLNELPENWRI